MGDRNKYLGDGVYVEVEDGTLRLSTKGICDENEIYLDPEVMTSLIVYYKELLGVKTL